MKTPLLVLALAALALSPGCSVDKQTQLTIAIQSEAEVPAELDTFTVTVTATRTNEVRFTQTYQPQDGKDFPTTLAVIPADEDSLQSPLKIDITGSQNNTVILNRTSIASYVEGRNLLLAMPLRMACFQFKDCGGTSTCAGGQCVDATVKSASLPNFEESFVSPDAPRCFDEEKCLAQKTQVDVANDCTFSLAGAAASNVNVAIRWAAAQQRILTLDSGDGQEGWTVDAATGNGKLSQGVCDSHFQTKGSDGKPLVADIAKEVYVTTGCASKTNLTPYCHSSVTNQAGVGAVSPE